MKLANWLGAALAASTAAGCFYVEPINQRPSLDIRRDSSESIQRGGAVSVYAKVDDPEAHTLFYQWRVHACKDAIDVSTCDPDPFSSGIENEFDFVVPPYLVDGTSTQAIRIVLDGTDELGAAAKPQQVETLPVVNGSPTLEIDKGSIYRFVVGTPVELYAVYSDPDDKLELITLDWTVFSPTQATAQTEDISVLPGTQPNTVRVGKRFIPNVTGEWEVKVIASDEVGPPTEKLLAFEIEPDGPPCLAQWSPFASTDPGAYLPITEPTIFQVPVVDDDLDRYPGLANPKPMDYFGQATFEWSIRQPGASSFQKIGTTNQVAIDPDTYTPGDRIEVRVEIFDRQELPVTCAPGDQLCALDSARPTCYQRQTWRVEAR